MSRNFEKLQFFSFGLTQCFYLTHSVREYFEKLAFKKNKKCSFKRLYLKSYDEFRVKINIFRKFIQFSFKQGVFLHALHTWIHDRPLRPLVPLPGPRGAKTVNHEPVKVLILLFFTSFFWEWAESFEKLQFFAFGPKQCFYLTHTARVYFEKLAFKKNKKCSFKRLYLKRYDEFRVKTNIFRKFIQFSFKQGVFFARSTHVGTRPPPTSPGTAARASRG